MASKRHSFWHGDPAKRGGIVKVSMKRGKQTIQGEHGPIAVFVSTTYRG